MIDNIGKRMLEQDRRATASPYLIVLQEQKKVYVGKDVEHDGKEFFDGDNCCTYDSMDEAYQDYVEHGYEDPKGRCCDLEEVYFRYYWEDVNWFFTYEGLNEHLRLNKHNYGKTRDYIKYCGRNPEMEAVQNLLLMSRSEPTEDNLPEGTICIFNNGIQIKLAPNGLMFVNGRLVTTDIALIESFKKLVFKDYEPLKKLVDTAKMLIEHESSSVEVRHELKEALGGLNR